MDNCTKDSARPDLKKAAYRFPDTLLSWPKLDMYLAEARFGMQQLSPYLDKLEHGAKVLEIGSGPGFLLRALSGAYPNLTFEGVEPVAEGFSDFESAVKDSRKYVEIHRCSYEELTNTDSCYDLIFTINVLEHVNDWRHALKFLGEKIKPAGLIIVLCPNYGFPYESHFRIPIIVNKAITFFFFRSRIEKLEKNQASPGLWNSLNFVTLKEIEATAQQLSIRVVHKEEIIEALVDRALNDRNFLERQAFLSKAAQALRRLGLMKILASYKLRWLHPYMKLEIRRQDFA